MGPDMVDSQGGNYLYGLEWLLSQKTWRPLLPINDGALYDPTNGTVSNGDIARVGP